MLACQNFSADKFMNQRTAQTFLSELIGSSMPGESIIATILPLCPEVQLYLVSSQTPGSQSIQANISQLMETPPYWALCWAGGQVLARYILDHPEMVKGKTVVDFGAGSGVVAIAAAMAGARQIYACDIDPNAIEAIKANAQLNHVELETCESIDNINRPIDLILAADLLYDDKNLPLLQQFQSCAERVLVADSRYTQFDQPNQTLLLQTDAATCPDLDNTGEYSRVSVYKFIE